MPDRRALIVAPLYDGQWLPPLAGRPVLVERLKRCLEDHGNYDIEILTNVVNPEDFIPKIQQLFDTDGELLLYFYGHGCLRSAQGFFATSNARLYNEGVSMNEVTQAAVDSAAREVILILDCCHAGAANPITTLSLRNVANNISSNNVGRCLLAACAEHQQGWEARTEDHKTLGAFSTYILDGLEGAACYGQDKVRASFLGAYVTEKFTSWRQDPISQTYETGSHHCVITSGFSKTTSQTGLKTESSLIIGIPFKPSQLFVGRSAEIDYLRAMLMDGSNPIALSATIEGLGGIGKTELVLHLLYDSKVLSNYKTIVWLDGAGPLPPQWEKVAIKFGISILDENPEDLIDKILNQLQKRGKSLIILDNASEWEPVKDLIPPNLPLLVTTRTGGFGGNCFIHTELNVLSDEAASDFLCEMVTELRNDPALPRLVEILAGHALALELAGQNISYLGISAGEYVERFTTHQKDLDLPQPVQATRYGNTVEGCLNLTWESLRYPASRLLWRRASLFAPTSAHRDLLKVSVGGDNKVRGMVRHFIREMERTGYEIEETIFYELLLNTPDEFSSAYAELRALHILSRVEGYNGERWAMHRLVRDYGRSRLQKKEVMVHAVAFSEWLKAPTLPLEPEIPHFVVTILDSARYVGEFEFGRARRGKSLEREISYRYSENLNPFNQRQFLYFIRDELRNPKALTVIFQGLTDMNDDVRQQAVRLLESVGPIPEVIEGLISSLDDSESQIRKIAEHTLVEYGNQKTIDILTEALQNSNQSVQLRIIHVLGQMGTEAHSSLHNALKNDNHQVRIEAALLLCKDEPVDSSEVIVNEIDSVDTKERKRLIDALGNTRDPRCIPTIRKYLFDSSCYSNVIVALGKMPQIADATEGLILCLEHNERDARVEAALLLCEQGRSDGINVLCETIQDASVSQNRRIINAFAKSKDTCVLPILSKLLTENKYRQEILQAVAEIGITDDVFDGLVACLRDSSYDIVHQAMKLLVRFGEKGSDAIKGALKDHNLQLKPEDQFMLVKIGLIDQKVPTQNIIDTLKSEARRTDLSRSGDWWTWRANMINLGKLKAKEAVPVLLEILENQVFEIAREKSAITLGEIGDSSAKPTLARIAKNDSCDSVRKAATQAIKEIDRQNA